MSDFMTTLEVLELLKVSRGTLERMRRKHNFPPAYKLTTKAYRYKRSDIENWLEERKEAYDTSFQLNLKDICYKKSSAKQKTIPTTQELKDFLDDYDNREGLLRNCKR